MLWRSITNRIAQPVLSTCARHCLPSLQSKHPRYICDRRVLRLEEYETERKNWFKRVNDLDAFWLRIFSLEDSDHVFEQDLKIAWQMAEQEHLPFVIRLTERFLKPDGTSSLFHSFKFGSVMMRACHSLNSVDAALEIFNNNVIQKHLNDAISVIVLMDLLIKNGKFDEAGSVFEHMQKLELFFILRNPFIRTLYAVALYKQGTAEALTKASQLVGNIFIHFHHKQRIEDIVASLALKLKEPELAISLVQKRCANSELCWNIKIQGHVLQSDWNTIFNEINQRKNHKLYRDTLELIQTSKAQECKLLKLLPVNTKVEEQVMATITAEENVLKQVRRFY